MTPMVLLLLLLMMLKFTCNDDTLGLNPAAQISPLIT
jgi:hypothetical protein